MDTPFQLEVHTIGETLDDSSYVIGNSKSNKLIKDLLNLNDMITPKDDDPLKREASKAQLLANSKARLSMMLSPTKEKTSVAFGTPAAAIDGGNGLRCNVELNKAVLEGLEGVCDSATRSGEVDGTAQKMNLSPECTMPEFIFSSVGLLSNRNSKDSEP